MLDFSLWPGSFGMEKDNRKMKVDMDSPKNSQKSLVLITIPRSKLSNSPKKTKPHMARFIIKNQYSVEKMEVTESENCSF